LSHAAVNAQALWEEVLKDRAFAKQIDRVLISYYPDFRIAAAELVLRLDYKQPSFVMPVDEENGEFVMMVGMGFFERAGEHYVMALPSQLTIAKVKAAAIAYAETEDEHYYLHPYRLVVTASLVETKANQSRLHAVAEFSHNESIHGLSKC
jgi:hypothetical protein